MNRFYLTTPIYYPNARPHVGSAYTTIVCDAIARYKRMCGYDVAFLTGTDEHGEKLQRAADAAGVPVERFVAEKRELFKELWRAMGLGEFRSISDIEVTAGSSFQGNVTPSSSRHDEDCGVKPPLPPIKRLFVHTSQNPAHVKSVHWMIRQADKAGYIAKKRYEGRYCVYDERYVSDSPEPVKCDICGRPAELISEENYFFKLSAFEKPLMELYERHEKEPNRAPFVLPGFRMNEVKSFVKSGLRDISISRRRLKWGIPWPDDPDQVVYVWYDALTSYLTGIGFEGEKRGEDFEKYWMGAEGPTEVVHMIGKDILRFHAVYWPAFLMAAGLPLPKTIFAHGWIYYEQDKMSKSKGNVVYPEPIVEGLGFAVAQALSRKNTKSVATERLAVPEDDMRDEIRANLRRAVGLGNLEADENRQESSLADLDLALLGSDALRYYLLRDTPFGQDSNFSYEGLIRRFNSNLANDLGNLANRTLTMIDRYQKGSVAYHPAAQDKEGGLREAAAQAARDFRKSFERLELSKALEAVWNLVSMANSYIVLMQPWQLAAPATQPDKSLLSNVLYNAAEAVRFSTVLLYPVIPQGAARLWKQLGCDGNIEDQRLDDLKWGGLKPGSKVGKPEPIFPRLDKEATLRDLHELAEQDRAREKGPKEEPVNVESQPEQKRAAVAPVSSPAGGDADIAATAQKISIDDFAKVEMRAGQVLAAEPIPGATKLLKLQVDIGSEVRQVCAGIAEHYTPEQIIGMKVVIVANLQPRKLRGVESNGMIVAASVGPDGKPVLATFKEDVPNGARLK